MKKRDKSLTIFYAVLSFILIQTACNKKPEKIGLEIIDENKLGVFDTTFTVTGYSALDDDSVRTDELSINLLGSLQTENFGLTNASFYSHIRLSQTFPNFGDDPQPDSAVLTLVYDGYYGFINTPHTAKVYEVMQDFYLDSSYYSNTKFNLEPLTELANFNFIPNPNDSIMQEDSTFVSAELRIPLNETFINKVMFPPDDSIFSSNSNFINYFKGIYVVTDSVSSPSEGSILYFDLLDPRSNVTIYYNDSLSFEFLINASSGTVGRYQHNYSKSLNQNFVDQVTNGDTAKGSEYLYLQGLAGIKTRLRLNSLADWAETNNYAVNEAKLVIPATESVEELQPPEQLLLFKYDENGEITVMEDQFEGDNYFGGTYNETSGMYEFRITLYVQSILNNSPDYGLVMLTSGKSVNANQVMLYGTDPDNATLPKMHLIVIYTLLE